jgi:hypothetical protein
LIERDADELMHRDFESAIPASGIAARLFMYQSKRFLREVMRKERICKQAA